jgi:hypothetical protein
MLSTYIRSWLRIWICRCTFYQMTVLDVRLPFSLHQSQLSEDHLSNLKLPGQGLPQYHYDFVQHSGLPSTFFSFIPAQLVTSVYKVRISIGNMLWEIQKVLCKWKVILGYKTYYTSSNIVLLCSKRHNVWTPI